MSAPNSNDILGSHRFTPAGQSSSPVQAPTADSIFGSTSQLDPSALHPLAGLVANKELDYLLLEDDQLSTVAGGKTVLPSRGWGDELCYGTGSTYLAGLALGGAWGFTEGFRRPVARPSQSTAPLAATPATAAAAAAEGATQSTTAPKASAVGQQATAFAKQAANDLAKGAKEAVGATTGQASQTAAKVSARLRWNNVLNQVTRRGTSTGNSAGVLALIYNGINSTIDLYRGGVHDV
ncbi:hypothetical protein JCM5353_006713, partial [Sporobolomyces roseus]